MALIASYLFDEGTGTTANDNQASPVDLTISDSVGWTSIAAGDGYDFNQTDTAESGNITSTNKIWTAVDSTAYTVIYIFRNDDQASTQSFWGIREDDFSQSAVRTRLNGDSAGGGNENTIRWIWNTSGSFWQSAQNVVVETTVYAMAQVYDSDNGTGSQRCRVYLFPLGGSMSQLTPSSFTEPTLGETTDFSTITNAVLGLATVVGIQPFNGALFYWGLWDEVLDDTTLESYMDQLLADNDADPSDTPAVVAFMPTAAGDFFRTRMR